MVSLLHRIKVRACQLAGRRISIPGSTGALNANVIRELELEPTSYSDRTHETSDTSWRFVVTTQGVVNYKKTLDVSEGAFLTDRGSPTLGIVGFAVTLDGTKLATRTYCLGGITDSLDNTKAHPLNLLPDRYQFYQGNNDAMPEADFEVSMDGQMHFPTSSDAILPLRDADRTLEITGFPITLDGRGLGVLSCYLADITNSLKSPALHPLRLQPIAICNRRVQVVRLSTNSRAPKS